MPGKKKQSKSAEFVHDFIFLRSAPLDGVTAQEYVAGGFSWPLEAGGIVEAPDWDPNPTRECGGGLHGLHSGIGDWELLRAPSDQQTLWYVCGALAAESVRSADKVRVKRCRVLYVGSFAGAMDLISPVMTTEVTRLAAEKVSRSDSGAASNSGYRGAAFSIGRDGVALSAGIRSRGMVANGSLLVLVERNDAGDMLGYFAAREGEKGVVTERWYELRDGALVDVTDES